MYSTLQQFMQIQNTDLPAAALSMRSRGGVGVHFDDVLVLFFWGGGGREGPEEEANFILFFSLG